MWSPQGRLTWLFCCFQRSTDKTELISALGLIHRNIYYVVLLFNKGKCKLCMVPSLNSSLAENNFKKLSIFKEIFFFFISLSWNPDFMLREKKHTRVISQIWSYTAQGTTLPRVHQQQHISCSFGLLRLTLMWSTWEGLEILRQSNKQTSEKKKQQDHSRVRSKDANGL